MGMKSRAETFTAAICLSRQSLKESPLRIKTSVTALLFLIIPLKNCICQHIAL